MEPAGPAGPGHGGASNPRIRPPRSPPQGQQQCGTTSDHRPDTTACSQGRPFDRRRPGQARSSG